MRCGIVNQNIFLGVNCEGRTIPGTMMRKIFEKFLSWIDPGGQGFSFSIC